jgi:hypothetical protein
MHSMHQLRYDAAPALGSKSLQAKYTPLPPPEHLQHVGSREDKCSSVDRSGVAVKRTGRRALQAACNCCYNTAGLHQTFRSHSVYCVLNGVQNVHSFGPVFGERAANVC